MNAMTQYWLRRIKPRINGLITKVIYYGSNVEISSDLRADSIPRILIDKECKLTIARGVELRRNVEIRLHNRSQIVIGEMVRIDRGVRLLAANDSIIRVGEGSRIGLYSVFNGGASIEVGKYSLISGFVYLQTSMHGYNDKQVSIQNQGYEHEPVTLEEDVWLGTHVVIMPGITIGKGSVVGSNAVVTKNVEPFQVVGGVPAKPIKERL
jgi:acetyltransferase-like isoleucine patch superfamily enzyme